ncbi:unnamed protein product [Vitrella brassicaformis CCMP3155]|uniref:Uncharacterized protein n=1 Tax=Vitrella brassicaformis (strain CCMP3155) TaxID=1169540 RepID=A0A0G4FA70_VITBC|nr:unnamed protein product [Vitrella brassicaformis CCMP3155]|eukprot:CEM09776.1 unnamed protein product [Vitrella brassicaformis CCMP3155]
MTLLPLRTGSTAAAFVSPTIRNRPASLRGRWHPTMSAKRGKKRRGSSLQAPSSGPCRLLHLYVCPDELSHAADVSLRALQLLEASHVIVVGDTFEEGGNTLCLRCPPSVGRLLGAAMRGTTQKTVLAFLCDEDGREAELVRLEGGETVADRLSLEAVLEEATSSDGRRVSVFLLYCGNESLGVGQQEGRLAQCVASITQTLTEDDNGCRLEILPSPDTFVAALSVAGICHDRRSVSPIVMIDKATIDLVGDVTADIREGRVVALRCSTAGEAHTLVQGLCQQWIDAANDGEEAREPVVLCIGGNPYLSPAPLAEPLSEDPTVMCRLPLSEAERWLSALVEAQDARERDEGRVYWDLPGSRVRLCFEQARSVMLVVIPPERAFPASFDWDSLDYA